MAEALSLGDRVEVTDLADDPTLVGETGEIVNDWLGMGGGTLYAVLLDGAAEPRTFVAGQIVNLDRKEQPMADPFPLVEETSDPSELPTVSEWLAAGAPMRETVGGAADDDTAGTPDHNRKV